MPTGAAKTKRKVTRQDTEQSTKWFWGVVKTMRASVRSERTQGLQRLHTSDFDSTSHPFIGGLFTYTYDPKLKLKLPVWDQFPLVIPVNLYGDGWLGLNLHYIPPEGRLRLLELLENNKRRAYTPKAYMKLSYPLLTSLVDTKLFEPCVHRYLSSHVRSSIVRIDDIMWDTAATLPYQQFHGMSSRHVWSGRHLRKK